MNPAHKFYVRRIFKFSLPYVHCSPSWAPQKYAPRFYKGHKKHALPLYERFKNVHHGFMKALKMCICFVWVFQKFAWRFMKVWTICISFDERLKNVHQYFMKVSKMCTSTLWAPSKSAAGRQQRPAARANWSVECTKVHRAWDCRRISHGGEKSLRRSAIVAVN